MKRSRLLGVFAALIALLGMLVTPLSAQVPPVVGSFSGAIAPGGVSIVSFTGSVSQLDAAGAASNVLSVTSATGGRLLTFVVGAPPFVNTEFSTAFQSGLSSTLLIVKTSSGPLPAPRPAGVVPSLPTPTATFASVATPVPTPIASPSLWADLPSTRFWVQGAASTGLTSSSSGQPLVPVRASCSLTNDTLRLGYPDGTEVYATGVGLGACGGWYRFASDSGFFWLPVAYLSQSAPTVVPTPPQLAPPRSPTPSPVPSSAGGGAITLATIDGHATLLADDGTYLGIVSSNRYVSESVCNQYGSYGSKYSSESVRNQYGSYGSKYSSESAYNSYTSSPPKIIFNRTVVGYLTKNRYLPGAVDPDYLFALYECTIR